jgi:hypothetical protein
MSSLDYSWLRNTGNSKQDTPSTPLSNSASLSTIKPKQRNVRATTAQLLLNKSRNQVQSCSDNSNNHHALRLSTPSSTGLYLNQNDAFPPYIPSKNINSSGSSYGSRIKRPQPRILPKLQFSSSGSDFDQLHQKKQTENQPDGDYVDEETDFFNEDFQLSIHLNLQSPPIHGRSPSPSKPVHFSLKEGSSLLDETPSVLKKKDPRCTDDEEDDDLSSINSSRSLFSTSQFSLFDPEEKEERAAALARNIFFNMSTQIRQILNKSVDINVHWDPSVEYRSLIHEPEEFQLLLEKPAILQSELDQFLASRKFLLFQAPSFISLY